MERAFIATKNTKYYKALEKYNQMMNEQKDFINKFFNENNIEAVSYLIRGDGGVNKPFEEWEKKDITLYIVPTDNDFKNFSKSLSKPKENGLCSFKKNSKIAKLFADKCIEEKVIVNIDKPSIGDYFYCLRYGGYNMLQIPINNQLYIKINSEMLDRNELPEGFTEIKLSEFYLVKEKGEK